MITACGLGARPTNDRRHGRETTSEPTAEFDETSASRLDRRIDVALRLRRDGRLRLAARWNGLAARKGRVGFRWSCRWAHRLRSSDLQELVDRLRASPGWMRSGGQVPRVPGIGGVRRRWAQQVRFDALHAQELCGGRGELRSCFGPLRLRDRLRIVCASWNVFGQPVRGRGIRRQPGHGR